MSPPSGSSDLSSSKALSPANLQQSRTPNTNQLDHHVRLYNRSTSILELSSQRLQLPKQDLSARVEELTRELGQLRCENQFYREGFENLQRLREHVYNASQQLFLAHRLDHDLSHLDNIIVQLRNALKDSRGHEYKAKKAWMEFWRINYIPQDH